MTHIPTALAAVFKDVRYHKPPQRAAKLILLSKYGVTTIGTYQPGFHIAWAELPKVPATLKGRM